MPDPLHQVAALALSFAHFLVFKSDNLKVRSAKMTEFLIKDDDFTSLKGKVVLLTGKPPQKKLVENHNITKYNNTQEARQASASPP